MGAALAHGGELEDTEAIPPPPPPLGDRRSLLLRRRAASACAMTAFALRTSCAGVGWEPGEGRTMAAVERAGGAGAGTVEKVRGKSAWIASAAVAASSASLSE